MKAPVATDVLQHHKRCAVIGRRITGTISAHVCLRVVSPDIRWSASREILVCGQTIINNG